MSSKSVKQAKPHQMTLLKFKRNKATYLLPVDLHLKSQLTLKNLVTQLVSAINSSGGLLLEEPIEKDVLGDDDDVDDDDILIPKSEFIDENEDTQTDKVAQLTKVMEEDINLAIPQDKTEPYGNKWIELTDATLAEVAFKDYDILGFKNVSDDGFNIIEAVYND